MPITETFRVNYYVGALLAQGGNVRLEESKIVFSPTSALDRAMGATDVSILLADIRSIEGSSGLSKAVRIQTQGKTHKFDGSQIVSFWDTLRKKLPSKVSAQTVAPVQPVIAAASSTAKSMPSSSVIACHHCNTSLQPGFSFCPHCGVRPKSICPSCQRTFNPAWVSCAYCGSKIIAKAA